jgi:CheY-like chemotaxis protein
LRTSKAMETDMRKILLIDDDAALREALEAVLLSHRHVVTSAQDGLAALRAAVEIRPEVIISDVNMPHLEGPDAVRILRALPRFRHVPVVLMSGAELPVTGLTQIALRKPVNPRQILELVEDIGWASTSLQKAPHHPPPRAAGLNEGWDPALAVASLWPDSNTTGAVRICRGIELMHAQAVRIDRSRRANINVEESVRLYDRLVESVASLVQCLPAEAPGFAARRRRGYPF